MLVKISHVNMNDFNKSNESLTVFGRIIPKYENDKWSYTEEIYSESYEKRYVDEDIDKSYVDDASKAVFFYYDDKDCVGRIRLRSNWNGYALMEDISVAKKWRGRGIGKELLKEGVEWARNNDFAGLMLETQDVNVSACRFYAKNNFVLGAVDTMLYTNFQTANEKAIFWYLKFEEE
ncbi:GNAT family N-acetyltransferase [Paenibacillus apis]|uniref:N-acetyltransferase domain-containing protein n=1 Tax=Paenibacillus apis TaxID=1792174 RepID=A0A919XYZ7_9BACL|nr:GNAT family N-acetyltransferase [Paenibacillus apis]GIO41569.1 hypothetical protein J41TS4_13270 [Paenibacillus apis]